MQEKVSYVVLGMECHNANAYNDTVVFITHRTNQLIWKNSFYLDNYFHLHLCASFHPSVFMSLCLSFSHLLADMYHRIAVFQKTVLIVLTAVPLKFKNKR